ncbi:MAG: hypothetical protein O2960_04570 [Verrucomicrobia bacterium]|nr:hypothetical protein [Verrucomicrobiota bacterium]
MEYADLCVKPPFWPIIAEQSLKTDTYVRTSYFSAENLRHLLCGSSFDTRQPKHGNRALVNEGGATLCGALALPRGFEFA